MHQVAKYWSFSFSISLSNEYSGLIEDLQDLLELTPQNNVIFIIEDSHAKVGNQEIPGETGNFDLEVQNEAWQRLIEFCQENSLVIANTLFQQHRDVSTHGHHQLAKTERGLFIFFAVKDGEALYNQQKGDQELTVAQISKFLWQN